MTLLTGRKNQTYMGKNDAIGSNYFYQKINFWQFFKFTRNKCVVSTLMDWYKISFFRKPSYIKQDKCSSSVCACSLTSLILNSEWYLDFCPCWSAWVFSGPFSKLPIKMTCQICFKDVFYSFALTRSVSWVVTENTCAAYCCAVTT